MGSVSSLGLAEFVIALSFQDILLGFPSLFVDTLQLEMVSDTLSGS